MLANIELKFSSKFLFKFRVGMQKISIVLALCVALTGCGGGGDGGDGKGAAALPSADPVDKYVGVWEDLCSQELSEEGSSPGAASERATFVFVKQTSSKIRLDLSKSKVQSYASTDCSGSVLSSQAMAVEAEFTVVGQKTIDGKLVDKIAITGGGTSLKDIVYLSLDKLYYGATDDGAVVDAEGYPIAIDTRFYLVRSVR